MLRIGLISDTHGLLRPEAVSFLQGSHAILHGGDVGDPTILSALERIAPVTAVRGNNDTGPWAEALRETQVVTFDRIAVFLLHDITRLDIDPSREGIRAVVCGHSHKPRVVDHDGVIQVNPGSAGPRRFLLPISVGELLVDGDSVSARTVELALPDRPSGRR